MIVNTKQKGRSEILQRWGMLTGPLLFDRPDALLLELSRTQIAPDGQTAQMDKKMDNQALVAGCPSFPNPETLLLQLVRERGLEPLHLAVQDPKSCASANSATLAGLP